MLKLEILRKIIDSKDFTVGGGSAAALAGAMAAGLVGMVARLSVDKNYGLSSEKYNEITREVDSLARKLLLGAEKDAQAFSMIKEAYSLPKESSEQKSIRATAIQKAAIGAATVPQDNAWRCYRVKELIILLKDKSNTNASSDLEIARLLSNTGLLGCILNIEVNLFLIKDENIKQKFQEQINQLRQYSQNIFSQR